MRNEPTTAQLRMMQSAGSRLVLASLVLLAPMSTRADDAPAKPAVSAPQAVREGNLFLKGGNPSAALERYGEAKAARPDAREIAFDEGLAHYALGEFDKARAAFERAAGGQRDELADDAIYSAGASDHAEAIAQAADPKLAMGKLESAMQQYQSVLSRRPQHEAARDANYKAASYWRQLKQQMEQQQQQQSQSGEQQQDEESQQEKQQQSPPQDQQQQQQEQQQQSASKQEQESQQQKEQQAQSQEEQAQEQKEEQLAEAQEKEDVSREQAERQLREMMQAQRDRKKQRREEVRRVPIQGVEKDW